MIFHGYRERAALIDQIQQARETLEKPLTLLQSAPVERHRLSLTLISPGGSIVGRAKLLANPTSKSRGASSQVSGSPRAWALRENFGSGEKNSFLQRTARVLPLALMPQMTVSIEKHARLSSAPGGVNDRFDEQPALLKKCLFVACVEFVPEMMQIVLHDGVGAHATIINQVTKCLRICP